MDWTLCVQNVRHTVGSQLWLLSEVRSGGHQPIQAAAFHLVIALRTSLGGKGKALPGT